MWDEDGRNKNSILKNYYYKRKKMLNYLINPVEKLEYFSPNIEFLNIMKPFCIFKEVST